MPPASRPPTRQLERELLASGHRLVAGMDEVGRGALAGPVSVGVCLVDGTTGRLPRGLRDSKLLAPAAREALCGPVRRWSVGSAVGHASPEEIDAIGIIAALRLAGNRALAALAADGLVPDVVILDGIHDWLTPPHDLFAELGSGGFPPPPTVRTQVKGDLRCAVVAGASVLAKCERDALMVDLAARHPRYGWDANKGYSAPDHLAALREHGPVELHRRSWRLPTADELEDAALVAAVMEASPVEVGEDVVDSEPVPDATATPTVRRPAPAGAAAAAGPGA